MTINAAQCNAAELFRLMSAGLLPAETIPSGIVAEN